MSEIKRRIVEIVNELDYVTVGNLLNRLGDEHRGDVSLFLRKANVAMFFGISEELADALESLLFEDGSVDVADCDPMCHFIDGSPLLKIPWAGKRMPNGGYKHPRMASICLRPKGFGTSLKGRLRAEPVE